MQSRPAVFAATLFLAVGGLCGPWAVAQTSAPAAVPPTPVVVAVDTSRSLDASTLGATISQLKVTLGALEAGTPTALMAFDDAPRWLAGPGASPAAVAGALDSLALQGNFTLLHDALFVATRELPDGGVVLLVTDGRDENSAVMVDDIARRCEAQNVRILSLGVGRGIEEKALRRLALVSNGAYLGTLGAVGNDELNGHMSAARDAVRETRQQAAAKQARAAGPSDQDRRPAAQPVAGGQAAAGGASGGEPPIWQRWWLWAAATLVALVLFVLGRRRRPPLEVIEEDHETEEAAADEAEAGMIRLELAQAPSAEPREAPEVTVDTTVFQQMSLDERLDHTRVMANHGVLVMHRNSEPPRTFLLDTDKAFAVGRDKIKNTLSVPDPALSSQHFKIVPREETFFFVDLESTNGSYINGRRSTAKRLRHLDRVRAGQVEFEFQSYSNV